MKKFTTFLFDGLITIVFISFIMHSCTSGEETDVSKTIPKVSTNEVYNITFTTAEVKGSVISDGGATIMTSGFCWSEISLPTINDFKTDNGNPTGEFRTNMQNLSEGTTYYVRAYASNSEGTGYGNEISFSTELSCQTMVLMHPGYEVWAGNTPYFSKEKNYDYFYSLDKYDYHFIGEGNTTRTFDTGNYKYYVIVSKYWNCFDAIQFKDGSYLANGQGYTLYTGLSEIEKITGAADNNFGIFGNKTLCPPEGKATYNAFITDDASVFDRGGGLTIFVGTGCQ